MKTNRRQPTDYEAAVLAEARAYCRGRMTRAEYLARLAHLARVHDHMTEARRCEAALEGSVGP